MTRVVVLPSDVTACGTYRMKWPAAAVHRVRPDWSIEVYHPRDVKLGTDRGTGALRVLQGVANLHEVDLIVVQRIGTRALAELVRWAQGRGIAVVLDADDALWAIDPRNPAHKAWNKPDNNWRWLDEAAKYADLVTVTTDALAKHYGAHGRVEVLPNVVPAEVTALPSLSATVVASEPQVMIGWAGFTATHPGDLAVVGDAVKRVAAEHPEVQVLIIGDAEGAARDWDLNPATVAQIAPQALGAPYYSVLSSLDVALVPLRDTPFNRAKSGLKAVEFSAVGVPVIASSTPAHRALAANRLPLTLAGSPEEWYEALSVLVSNPERRRILGADARARVASLYTYTAQAEAWAVAWERAMTRRARMTP